MTYEKGRMQVVADTQREEEEERRKPVVALAVDSSAVEAEDSLVDRSPEVAFEREAEGKLGERCLAVRLQCILVLCDFGSHVNRRTVTLWRHW